MSTKKHISEMFNTEKDKKEMLAQAEDYEKRADLLEVARIALEKYSKMEKEKPLVDNPEIVEDIENAYASIKALENAHRRTAKVAREMSASDAPVVTALENLLALLKEKK